MPPVAVKVTLVPAQNLLSVSELVRPAVGNALTVKLFVSTVGLHVPPLAVSVKITGVDDVSDAV